MIQLISVPFFLASPNDYAQFADAPVPHPLVSTIHYDDVKGMIFSND